MVVAIAAKGGGDKTHMREREGEREREKLML